MGQLLDEPVLVLKSCIGNRSLAWDLLPPGSSGNRGSSQYHGRCKIAPARCADHVAQELPTRQSRAAVCELGGGTELAVGSRSKNGSEKTIGARSLDASPQGRNISRAKIVMDKTYIEIVRLLLESAPAIFETQHFAMKPMCSLTFWVSSGKCADRLEFARMRVMSVSCRRIIR